MLDVSRWWRDIPRAASLFHVSFQGEPVYDTATEAFTCVRSSFRNFTVTTAAIRPHLCERFGGGALCRGFTYPISKAANWSVIDPLFCSPIRSVRAIISTHHVSVNRVSLVQCTLDIGCNEHAPHPDTPVRDVLAPPPYVVLIIRIHWPVCNKFSILHGSTIKDKTGVQNEILRWFINSALSILSLIYTYDLWCVEMFIWKALLSLIREYLWSRCAVRWTFCKSFF